MVLVDVNMPGMDGFELARELRRSHPETLVALISAQHPDELPPGRRRRDGTVWRRRTCGPSWLRAFWQEHRRRYRRRRSRLAPPRGADLSNRKLTALAAAQPGALRDLRRGRAGQHRPPPTAAPTAAIAALTVAALLGVGLYAWRRGGQGRFGQVLFVTGLCWFLATLSNSDVDLLYSVGRVAGWVFEVVLVYALLSYPTGRLEGRAARLVVVGGALLVALLYLPTIPLVDQYPLPTPFTTCTAALPANAFFLGSEPGFLDDRGQAAAGGPDRRPLHLGGRAAVAAPARGGPQPAPNPGAGARRRASCASPPPASTSPCAGPEVDGDVLDVASWSRC